MCDLVHDFATKIAESNPECMPLCCVLTYWRRRISVTLQKHQSILLYQRYCRVAATSNGTDCALDEGSNIDIVTAVCV